MTLPYLLPPSLASRRLFRSPPGSLPGGDPPEPHCPAASQPASGLSEGPGQPEDNPSYGKASHYDAEPLKLWPVTVGCDVVVRLN